MTSPQLTTTDTGGDASLDLSVQTPVVTDSLNKQQTHFVISDEEAGTAPILARIPPNLAPPDPSDVKIKLPDYVHELLANFDVHHHDLIPSGATLRFKPNEIHKIKARKLLVFQKSIQRPSAEECYLTTSASLSIFIQKVESTYVDSRDVDSAKGKYKERRAKKKCFGELAGQKPQFGT